MKSGTFFLLVFGSEHPNTLVLFSDQATLSLWSQVYSMASQGQCAGTTIGDVYLL
jgi:hypothetical protein